MDANDLIVRLPSKRKEVWRWDRYWWIVLSPRRFVICSGILTDYYHRSMNIEMRNDLSLHHSGPKGNFIEEMDGGCTVIGARAWSLGFGVSKWAQIGRNTESQSLHLTTSLLHILVCMPDVVLSRRDKYTTCQRESDENILLRQSGQEWKDTGICTSQRDAWKHQKRKK